VAGALQDYGRALIVGGKSTHGKGTVQSMSQLAPYMFFNEHFYTSDAASLGALKYTTNKFYRVSGLSTQWNGVESDIVLPSIYDYMELGEQSLENALVSDKIESAEYDKVNRVQPYLAELKKRSDSRVAEEKDFFYVREDIEQEKKLMGDKSVSLNEKQRLKESEELEARARAREREVKARKHTDEKVYKITLKQVDQPGLPAPLAMNEDASISTNLAKSATESAWTNNPDHLNAASTSVATAPKPDHDAVDADGDPAAAKTGDPAELSPEERAPMEETEHILMDYISLMHAHPAIAAQDKR
jgi:carboxyl-terminal processing protease